MNQIINMFMRIVMNRLMRMGINKGVDMASKGRQPKAPPAAGQGKDQKQINDRAKMLRKFRRF